jgi:hypothetical protein
MNTFTSTVTNYNGNDDVITRGLTLEQAVLKVQRNVYGYDHDEKYIVDSISAFASSDRGVNFFCADDTAQVKIKLEG